MRVSRTNQKPKYQTNIYHYYHTSLYYLDGSMCIGITIRKNACSLFMLGCVWRNLVIMLLAINNVSSITNNSTSSFWTFLYHVTSKLNLKDQQLRSLASKNAYHQFCINNTDFYGSIKHPSSSSLNCSISLSYLVYHPESDLNRFLLYSRFSSQQCGLDPSKNVHFKGYIVILNSWSSCLF